MDDRPLLPIREKNTTIVFWDPPEKFGFNVERCTLSILFYPPFILHSIEVWCNQKLCNVQNILFQVPPTLTRLKIDLPANREYKGRFFSG
jgi:hypothetical protein